MAKDQKKKDDLPAMPFYVGDWLKAPDIQCLSYELKGLWFEILCFMWESTERGYLVKANCKPYSNSELSRLLRLPEDLLEQNLKQLSEFAIYSIRESDGAIYSRRMVRDQEIREIRKKAGSLGGKRSFASRFAQAKTQANAEDEYVYETVNEIEDIRKIWRIVYKTLPGIVEAEFVDELITKYGLKKAERIIKELRANNFMAINTMRKALDDKGNIKPKESNETNQRSKPRGSIDFDKWQKELDTIPPDA